MKKIDPIWIQALATIFLLIVAGLSLYYSNKTSTEAFNLIKEVSQSKTAYIDIKPTIWGKDTIFYDKETLAQKFNQKQKVLIGFTIQNTGRIDTGRVRVFQENPNSIFYFNDLDIENIERESSIQMETNLTILQGENLTGEHTITFRIFCANCFEQELVKLKEIKIVVYE